MHDLDDLDSFDEPDDDALRSAFDLGAPGLGGATRAAALAAPARARALLAGETGLRFDSLVLFAEPAFQRFELDLADAFALREAPDAADAEVVAMLEAARLMWAYFELPPAGRARRRIALAVHLLGAEPSEDDWVEVEAVLDATEPYREAMLPEERAAARQSGVEWLDWDALTEHPSYRLDEEGHDVARGYGRDGLSELEARAAFAQPLLETAAASGDADALEAAMERASHYWHVAQTPEEDRTNALADAVAALAPTPEERPAVADEARRMVARYHELFGEEGAG
jgi:hypothetical protein